VKVISKMNCHLFVLGIYAKPNIKRSIIKSMLKHIDVLHVKHSRIDVVVAGDFN